jgi:hypothetical protein
VESDDRLVTAQVALDRHDWQAAYESLAAEADDQPLAAADLARLAEAARWSGHAAEVVPLLEEVAARFTAEGDRHGAARATMDLAREHWTRGDGAVTVGCAGHAARLLEGLPECPEHGLLEVLHAIGALELGAIDEGLAHARNAIAIGRRTGSRDAEALGLLWEGHALLVRGQVDEGRTRLDEANAVAAAGELGLAAAGSIFCSTLWACRNLGDWRRPAHGPRCPCAGASAKA